MQVFYNVYVKNNCCEGSAIETLWQKQTERLYFLVKDWNWNRNKSMIKFKIESKTQGIYLKQTIGALF